MVSSGNGTIGAEKLTEEVFSIIQRVPDLVKNLTGVDIAKVRIKTCDCLHYRNLR